MKKILFLVHDPGGYDAVYPVFEKLYAEGHSVEFYCVGPASKLNVSYAFPQEEIIELIRDQLAENRLRAVVTGTSWGSDLELQVTAMCKEANIPTFVILDYWINYLLRLSEPSGKVILPDYYIVMDDLAKEEAIREGVLQSILYPLGHPGLDRFFAKRTGYEKQPDQYKKILFLSQPLSKLYEDTLGYTEREVLQHCVDIVQMAEELSLQVKFHPKDDASLQEQFSGIAVTGELIDLLPQYDLIIGMNTIGLLHAVLMGVPAISYQPNLKQSDMCITTKLGLTPLLTSFDQLKSYLVNGNQNESHSSVQNALSKFIWADGKSTARVYSFLLEELGNEN